MTKNPRSLKYFQTKEALESFVRDHMDGREYRVDEIENGYILIAELRDYPIWMVDPTIED